MHSRAKSWDGAKTEVVSSAREEAGRSWAQASRATASEQEEIQVCECCKCGGGSDALRVALKTEEDGREMYNKASENATNSFARFA